MQRFQNQLAKGHHPDQAHTGGINGRDNFNLRAVKVNADDVGSFFIRIAGSVLRGIGLQTETLQRHTRRNEIVNGQIEGHYRRQMTGLVKGGA